MLTGLLQIGDERSRRATPPEVTLRRLQEHQRQFAAWLLGPAPHAPGDLVTIRRDAPIGGHGDLFMVVDLDRRVEGAPREPAVLLDVTTEPPPRSRKTGLREDVRVAFIATDPDASFRAMWLEGWMLEPWSVEQARHHQQLSQAEPGRAQ